MLELLSFNMLVFKSIVWLGCFFFLSKRLMRDAYMRKSRQIEILLERKS